MPPTPLSTPPSGLYCLSSPLALDLKDATLSYNAVFDTVPPDASRASRGALFDAAREAGAYSNLEKHGSGFLDLHGLSVGHQVEAPGLVAPEQRGPSARPAARKAQAAPGRPGAQPQRHASSP